MLLGLPPCCLLKASTEDGNQGHTIHACPQAQPAPAPAPGSSSAQPAHACQRQNVPCPVLLLLSQNACHTWEAVSQTREEEESHKRRWEEDASRAGAWRLGRIYMKEGEEGIRTRVGRERRSGGVGWG